MINWFPTDAGGLTPTWINAVLGDSKALGGCRVDTVDATPIGEQGQTSQVLRLALSYDASGDAGPKTMIAKLPSPSAAVRAVQSQLGSYAREVCFYRAFGDDSGISVPECYAAELDPETGGFLLLLEDMSECRVGDIWTSSLADVRRATAALAKMHARWWCDPTLRSYEWLPQHNDPDFAQLLGGAYKGSLPIALEKYPTHLVGYIRDVGLRLADRWDAWIAHREGDPFTLIHNDFHPKQLFFPGSRGGRFAVFDWQSVVSGPPTFDLSRLLLKGLNPSELRAHRDELLLDYHAGLVQGGANIEVDDVAAAFRSSLLHTLAYTVFVLARTDVEELDSAASARGVDYRDRLIRDLAESLEDNRVDEALSP